MYYYKEGFYQVYGKANKLNECIRKYSIQILIFKYKEVLKNYIRFNIKNIFKSKL